MKRERISMFVLTSMKGAIDETYTKRDAREFRFLCSQREWRREFQSLCLVFVLG